MSLCPDGACRILYGGLYPRSGRRPLNPQRTACTSPGAGPGHQRCHRDIREGLLHRRRIKGFCGRKSGSLQPGTRPAWAGDGEKAPAVLNACTLADGTASLLIDFSSPAAYMEFMAAYPDEESGVQVKALSILSMEEAELGDVSLTAAAGKEKGTAVPADRSRKNQSSMWPWSRARRF